MSNVGILRANDFDVAATSIPATSCMPATSSDRNKMAISNGAWSFQGTNTGTVNLYCPITFNHLQPSNSGSDNDISRYRIYYRDPDGGLLGIGGGFVVPQRSRIETRLVFRKSDGLYSAGTWWNSDSTPSNAKNNTVAYKTNVHDVAQDALYSFVVKMYRANTSIDSPTFGGIDFPIVPVP